MKVSVQRSVFAIFCAGMLAATVQAGTVRLADGSVLTGEVQRVSESIVQVGAGGSLRFLGIEQLHPDERSRFAKSGDVSVPAQAAPSPDGTGGPMPSIEKSVDESLSLAVDESSLPDRQADGDEQFLEATITRMMSTSFPVRVEALREMRRQVSPDMLDPLLARLVGLPWRSMDEEETLLGELLAGMGEDAIPRILEVSHLPEGESSEVLLGAMGFLGDRRVTERLAQIVEQSRDEATRRAALESLARIRTPEAIEAAIGPLCRAVDEDDEENSECLWAVRLLDEMGDRRAVEPLIRAFDRELWPSGSQYQIADALARTGDRRALRSFLRKAGSSNGEMRLLVAEALGKLGNPSALNPLMSLMMDWDDDVRKAAAIAIGRIGNPRTANVLVALLNADIGFYGRLAALDGLVEMGGAEARSAVVWAMKLNPDDDALQCHGAKALEDLDRNDSDASEKPSGGLSPWYVSTWIGFLFRCIAILAVFMWMSPFGFGAERSGRETAWFERHILIVLMGLCGLRLMYLAVLLIRPGMLKMVFFAGMPLARYPVCALMDALIPIKAARAVFRQKRWGWPLLLVYLPTTVALDRYDYGYWTLTMRATVFFWLAILAAYGVGFLLARRSEESDAADEEAEPLPAYTGALRILWVCFNVVRLGAVAWGVWIALQIVLMFGIGTYSGWIQMAMAISLLGGLLLGAADAAIMVFVNRLLLKAIERRRRGSRILHGLIDLTGALVLAGVCAYGVALLVWMVGEDGMNEGWGTARFVLSAAAGCLAAFAVYPVVCIRRGRADRAIAYFAIVTLVLYILIPIFEIVRRWAT